MSARFPVRLLISVVCVWLVPEAMALDEVEDAVGKKDDAVKTLDGFYHRKIEDLENEFVDGAAKIREELLKTLETLKAKAAQANDLDAANQINERQEEIRTAKVEAPKVDKTTARQPEIEPDFSGSWMGKWGTNSRSLRLVIGKDNKLKMIDSRGEIQELEISKAGDRYLVVKTDHHDLELIRQDERLIVLGWSKSKDRHIMVDPPNLMAILVPGQ